MIWVLYICSEKFFVCLFFFWGRCFTFCYILEGKLSLNFEYCLYKHAVAYLYVRCMAFKRNLDNE